MAERIALSHHERWNGSGYPHGLCGEAIPLEARIVGLADVLDALTHRRPYRAASTIAEALSEVMNELADLGEKMGADPASWRTTPP